jgi:hypothetical protein
MFFLDILRLKVGSLQWLGPLLSHRKFLILLFQTSLLDWESWKNKVKTGAGPLKGPPWGAKKRQKSVKQ